MPLPQRVSAAATANSLDIFLESYAILTDMFSLYLQELAIPLTRKIDLKDIIWNKVRALAEEGNFNKEVF